MPATHGDDDEQRYLPRSRAALSTAVTLLVLAGVFGLLGHPSMAIGSAVIGGASLVWAAVYVVMYRV